MNKRQLISLYWFPTLATLAIWGAALIWGGPQALFTVFVLTLLEITFSADNAVVNSKVLLNLSPFWQKLFLTVGIIFAVFLVRFALPIFIVMFSAGLGFAEVLNLALHDAKHYAEHLEHAAPVINAFGGTFLLMIALSYFIDHEKQTHWLGWLEQRLGKLGRFDNITTLVMLLTAIILYLTVGAQYQATVLFAAITAMALHGVLDLLDAVFDKSKKTSKVVKTGMAGFAAFMYLQVLDASFSLDGVIGAFAITTGVFLIMAGLGAGAVWVRAMTIHLTQAKTLSKYIFLEHGAHWAIGFLGAIMLLHLYHVELPEWIVGSLGLGFIAVAIWWSVRHQRSGSL
ncbi:MAG TPA: DUF475 domain-containing protein [Candidatus Saccharimonadales bacterium]|nr:DUF475 domain-containing protein [Candidatus Saccharimonadales bacterium]